MIRQGSSTKNWSNLIKRPLSILEPTQSEKSIPPFRFYNDFFEEMARHSDDIARHLYELSRALGPGEALDTIALMVRLSEKLKAAIFQYQAKPNGQTIQQFNISLTHNLRNPIAHLRTYTEMLTLLGGDDERAHSLRHSIARMNRLTTLISDIAWLTDPNPRRQETAVSLLHIVQTPNMFDKPARVTLTGSGVLHTVQAHKQALRQAISHVCWVLAGQAPDNHIQIDSDLHRGMALLTLWNASLTLKPEKLIKYQDELEVPLLRRRDPLNGVILPLSIATKLIQNEHGLLTVTQASPTRVRLLLPLAVGVRAFPT